MKKNLTLIFSLIVIIVAATGIWLSRPRNPAEPTPTVPVSPVAAPVASDDDQPTPATIDLRGSWQDSLSQRASLHLYGGAADEYFAQINWGRSAQETDQWLFSGTFDPATLTLTYTDETHLVQTTTAEDETSEEVLSSNGSGSLTYDNGQLRWTSETGTQALFEQLLLPAPAAADIAHGQSLIETEFARFGEGFILQAVTYNPALSTDPAELDYVNTLERGTFDAVIVYDSLFHTPASFPTITAWEADIDYTWVWYVAHEVDGDWQIVTYGY